MKSITKVAAIAVVVLLGFHVQIFAIEDLKLSLQCSNVVLSWPSAEGKSYSVSYRRNLDPTNLWQVLASEYPADTATNKTFFIHSNAVQYPNCGGNGAFAAFSSINASQQMMTTETREPMQPMAMRVDGSGALLPVAIFPPGFEFTNYLIFNPGSDGWFTGCGYFRAYPKAEMQATRMQPNGPLDGDPDGAGSDHSPEAGFYQVVQNGVQVWTSGLISLTNGFVSNTISIPFEAGNGAGGLAEATVVVDGTRYRGVTPFSFSNFLGTIQLDTSFLENGDHTLQVLAGWWNPDTFDVNTPVIHQESEPFTLTVSNVIYYPDWQDEIGELGFASYSFKTTCTNGSWQIDIYDVSNNLAKTLTGQTADGIVETNWDLIDINGIMRATNDADSEFAAVITVGDPIVKAAPKQSKSMAFPDHGRWVIAYEDIIGNMANSNAMWNAVYQFGSIGAPFGGAISGFPTPGHPENGQTFPLRFAWTNDPSPPTPAQKYADEKELVSLLTNNLSRNFFFFGHGSPNSLYSIDGNALSYYLKKHFYRFVFLSGCSTAAGNLPAAFGINFNSTKDISYFQKNGIRPRAFLGYSRDIFYASTGNYYDSSNGQTYPGRVEQRCIDFLNNFEFYWYFYLDVSGSIYAAENDTPDLRYGWNDGPDLTLFGYEGLYIDQYNQRTDWSN